MARKATMRATKKRRPQRDKIVVDTGFYGTPTCNTCDRLHFGPCMDKNFETRTSFTLGPLGVGIQISGYEHGKPHYVEAFLSWNDAAEWRDAISRGIDNIRLGKNPGERQAPENRGLGPATLKGEGRPVEGNYYGDTDRGD